MKIKPIKNHIVFQFVDEVDSKGQFVTKTDWGFEIRGHFDDSAKSPRWANVVEVGPECKTVKPGQQVLINALKWTMGFKLDGERYWRTDETQVALVRNSTSSAITPLHNIVVFRRHADIINEGKYGLQVVGAEVVETPKGTVTLLGPECEKDLTKAEIYFSDENFFNKFEHKDETLWYIDEMSILAYEPA